MTNSRSFCNLFALGVSAHNRESVVKAGWCERQLYSQIPALSVLSKHDHCLPILPGDGEGACRLTMSSSGSLTLYLGISEENEMLRQLKVLPLLSLAHARLSLVWTSLISSNMRAMQ